MQLRSRHQTEEKSSRSHESAVLYLLLKSKDRHAMHDKDNKIAGQVLEMHKIDRPLADEHGVWLSCTPQVASAPHAHRYGASLYSQGATCQTPP